MKRQSLIFTFRRYGFLLLLFAILALFGLLLTVASNAKGQLTFIDMASGAGRVEVYRLGIAPEIYEFEAGHAYNPDRMNLTPRGKNWKLIGRRCSLGNSGLDLIDTYRLQSAWLFWDVMSEASCLVLTDAKSADLVQTGPSLYLPNFEPQAYDRLVREAMQVASLNDDLLCARNYVLSVREKCTSNDVLKVDTDMIPAASSFDPNEPVNLSIPFAPVVRPGYKLLR